MQSKGSQLEIQKSWRQVINKHKKKVKMSSSKEAAPAAAAVYNSTAITNKRQVEKRTKARFLARICRCNFFEAPMRRLRQVSHRPAIYRLFVLDKVPSHQTLRCVKGVSTQWPSRFCRIFTWNVVVCHQRALPIFVILENFFFKKMCGSYRRSRTPWNFNFHRGGAFQNRNS